MRKGRFDEIFFVDLPGPAEREAIFAIHLEEAASRQSQVRHAPAGGRLRRLHRRRDRAGGDLRAVCGLCGKDGMHAPSTFLAAIQATQPLSVVMREHVEQLRAWAHGRCVMAD